MKSKRPMQHNYFAEKIVNFPRPMQHNYVAENFSIFPRPMQHNFFAEKNRQFSTFDAA